MDVDDMDLDAGSAEDDIAPDAEAEKETESEVNTDEEKPQKKPGMVRKSFVILVLLLGGGTGGSAWWFKDSMARDALIGSAQQLHLQVADELQVEVDLLGGGLSAKEFVAHQGDRDKPVLAWTEATVDIDTMSMLGFGSETAVDRLALTGLTGSFRRKADGGLPIIDDNAEQDGEAAPDEQEPGWQDRDWKADYQRLQEWREQYRSWVGEDEAADGEAQPEPIEQPAFNWPEAKQFAPTPEPGAQRRWLLRELDISGGAFGLPDESPLDIDSFTVSGRMLTNVLRPGETMSLQLGLNTRGAGKGDITMDMTAAGGGLKVMWPAFPASVLQDGAIGGDVARFAPDGTVEAAVDLMWKGNDLHGTITLDVAGLRFEPPSGSDQFTQLLAQALRENSQDSVRWIITVGGSVDAPRITDYGLKALVEQLLGGIGDQLAARLRGELDKHLAAYKDEAMARIGDLKGQAQAEIDKLRGELEAQKAALAEQRAKLEGDIAAKRQELEGQFAKKQEALQADFAKKQQQLQGEVDAKKQALQQDFDKQKQELNQQVAAERQKLEQQKAAFQKQMKEQQAALEAEKKKLQSELQKQTDAAKQQAGEKVQDAASDALNKWLK